MRKKSNIYEAIRPKLRLFLSVDLIGSTSLKHNGTFPIKDPSDISSIEQFGADWFGTIAEFFRIFEEKLQENWSETQKRYSHRVAQLEEIPCKFGDTEIEFWKGNGDEMIFVVELQDLDCLRCAMSVWFDTIIDYKKSIKSNGLDVKSTAWLAGFPVNNTEIVITSRGHDISVDQIDLNPYKRNLILLDKWYHDRESREKLKKDYIGPSIDLGFRLSGLSTSRQMMISADLAFALTKFSNVASPLSFDHLNINYLKLRYEGEVVLKGVLRGKGYPLFWIDLSQDDEYSLAHDDLTGQKYVDRDKIARYCTHFFTKYGNSLIKPFIYVDGEYQISEPPPNYRQHIKKMEKLWPEIKNSGQKISEQLRNEDLHSSMTAEQDAAIKSFFAHLASKQKK
ncbi:MAG: hypothetical protein VYB54_10540 [Pseudomonadota bacterium]|nr:hypothetical protein [Pseudomonadota bacterium]